MSRAPEMMFYLCAVCPLFSGVKPNFPLQNHSYHDPFGLCQDRPVKRIATLGTDSTECSEQQPQNLGNYWFVTF